MLRRRLDLWLPTYFASAPYRFYRSLDRVRRHTHVIFLVCDHFEPRHDIKTRGQDVERMNAWHTGYSRFQQRCRDEFGTAPLHTWFYPPHHGTEHLAPLAAMAHAGMGEVELHYHHNGDTEATLERDLRATLAEYNRWGLLLESGEHPRTSFGFVHGDWALCNSAGGHYCGVNNELAILQKLGCWADFTMPSAERCQTRKINSIYYARGNPDRPKSHNWGPDARAGRPNPEGLMFIQGPLGINWRAPSYPRVENASLTTENWGRPDRIRKWIDCHVHVRGRPDWLFVKLHTHGAIENDFDALFGERALQMHRMLNRDFNDGKRFSLHYVTARQAFNIARAAECGHVGNPADYVDFCVHPPATAHYNVGAPHTLEHCSPDHLKLSAIECLGPIRIQTRVGPIASARGHISAFEVDDRCGQIHVSGEGRVELSLRDENTGADFNVVSGCNDSRADAGVLSLAIAGRCTVSYRKESRSS
jgi:hypothetical protein